MDIIAHSLTLLSIVIGIGLTEMFGNFHKLIRNRARVTWDWLPVAWAATLLILVINYWWGLYLGAVGLKDVRNAAEFGLVLVPAVLLFLSTASVLPNFADTQTWDMHLHYGEQRRTFILTFMLYQCSTWATALMIGTFRWDLVGLQRAIILALLVGLMFINRRKLDWIVVGLIMAVLIFRLTAQLVK
jgi:hypothetical protein